ncbi:hypothetical protein BH24ACT4_BH24ACT4_07350 [soil metagenome]
MSGTGRRSSPSGGRGAASRPAGKAKGGARSRTTPEANAKAVARRRRLAAGLLVSVVLVGFLLVGVFPSRAWLSQRDELSTRNAELAALEGEQAAIDDDVAELQTPEEIERIAREEYGMTRPEETPFRMLPGAVPPVDLPDSWPFTGTEDWLNR